MGPLYLVDLGRVYIDVDDGGLPAELVGPAHGPVVEARAERDDEVRLVEGDIAQRGAVHAEHAQVEGVVGREGAEAHQREGDGYAVLSCELPRAGAGSPT